MQQEAGLRHCEDCACLMESNDLITDCCVHNIATCASDVRRRTFVTEVDCDIS